MFHFSLGFYFYAFFVSIVWTMGSVSAATLAHQVEEKSQLPDFQGIESVELKKKQFFTFLRPIIEQELLTIRKNRASLLSLKETPDTLTDEEQAWLGSLMKRYKVVDKGSDDDWEALLKKMDTVPIELIMAQAANESAWGTSRFAVQGNNLFGQWCYRPGCGMVPESRSADSRHEVAKFSNPAHSIRAYLLNINTHAVYLPLREIRAMMRKQNQPLIAEALALGLIKYSERGEAYIKTIQQMIRVNRPLMIGQWSGPS